ncbi:hypothetical protein M427DRAFT_71487 [Gonapodya prolifera JEL478]|uniref:Citrate transporter-like domain-containing protein n=1 Tax=Gonapodya prolifera (strain JEL478) TaxID=1344416 RepID=A0A139A9B9_GONPJ|nr:hypothetical protein M427DRAFT_71487 [Gonapodya prolifera JEL478]|eukprot:KXS13258.1 hypothetical protein M427DRAFT_71487 [Gonapodya prolifera JEL478]
MDAATGALYARAGGDGAGGNGPNLSIGYAVPFIGLLLSIAIGPLAIPHLWEHWYPLFTAVWSLAFFIPFAVQYGITFALYEVVHALILDYFPFILLVTSLYTSAGGLVVRGRLSGRPGVNTLLMVVGTILASVIGTTGASMVMIRPLLRSIANRRYRIHSIVFFIFLVSNIGGCLTPIGDPPVFIGFLRGVDFFWPLTNAILPFLLTAGVVTVTYFAVDVVLWRREGHRAAEEDRDVEAVVGEEKPAGDVKDDVSKPAAGARTPTPDETLEASPKDAGSTTGHLESSATVTSDTSIPLSPLSRYSTVGTLSDRKGLLVDEADKGNAKQHFGDGDHAPGKAMNGDKEEREGDWAHFVQDEVEEVEEEVLEVESLKVVGLLNITLLLLIVADVVVSGYMKKNFPNGYVTVWNNPGHEGDSIQWYYGDIASDLFLALIVVAGWKLTPKARFQENKFSWGPIREVAILFLGIFLTLVPILLIFSLGESGSLGWLVSAVTTPTHYFWASGGLSSFLDNAPTYALFFGEAGGDPVYLMNEGRKVLTAINCGSVFMGANTYIGNAPNFLVRGIAQENGLQMPSFFAYMLCAICILGPIFVVNTFIFFWS